jgi:hypothetical protein
MVSDTHLGPKTRFLLLSDSWGFVDIGRLLWGEGGFVVYNCCWPSPARSFSGTSPAGLMTIFYCLRFDTLPTWVAQLYHQAPCSPFVASYDSQGYGGGIRTHLHAGVLQLLAPGNLRNSAQKTPLPKFLHCCLRTLLSDSSGTVACLRCRCLVMDFSLAPLF